MLFLLYVLCSLMIKFTFLQKNISIKQEYDTFILMF